MTVAGIAFTVIVLCGLSFAFLQVTRKERRLRPRVLAARERGLIWSGPVDVRLSWEAMSLTRRSLFRLPGLTPFRSRGVEAWVHPGAIEIGTQSPAPNAHWLIETEDTVVTGTPDSALPGEGWLILKSAAYRIAIRENHPQGLAEALQRAGFRVFAPD